MAALGGVGDFAGYEGCGRGSGRSAIGGYRRAAFGILIAGALSGTAFAQSVPDAPRAPTREEIERTAPRPGVQAPARLTVEGGIERAPCALGGEAYRDVTFQVNRVEFANLKGLDAEALRPAWQAYAGTTQPVAVICEIRDRAATILRDAGYVAAVEVPEQRIADGTVRFEVLMAKLVAVRVRGDAGGAEQVIAGYLGRLTEQEVFNRFQAERYLLLAGDLPGYDVRLALRSANAGRGEVIGEVAVLRTAAEIDLNVQNFGSKDLGRWGALLRGQFYGLTGLGDRTSISLFSTADFREQQTVQVAHDFRVGSEGLTLSGQFTYAWADPDLDDSALDVKARTLIATAEASFPFLRTQSRTARGAAGLDVINQRVTLNGIGLTRDRLRVAYVRFDLDAVDEASLARVGGFSSAEPRWRVAATLEARRGLDIFGASDDCGPALAACSAGGRVPISRLEGDPTATLLRFETFGEVRPVPNIAFALGMRAQHSGDALLSFEEFSGGNYTVGRGYDPGAILGDRGIGFQAELRFGSIVPRALDAVSVQPYLFLDAAKVWNEDKLTPDVRNDLVSAGGGVRGIWRGTQLDVSLAVPFERVGALAERPDPRLLISLTTRLLPWSFK